jgi:anti-sigma factor RsiW
MRLKMSSDTPSHCRQLRADFSAYLDGVLPSERNSEIHEHLGYCRSCSEEFDRLCRAVSILVDFRNEPLPDTIRNFRVPRSLFIHIFHAFEERKQEITFQVLVPYFSALVFFFAMLTTWASLDHLAFKQQYNRSNYVEVRG